jgi:predicted nucleic acid-binding protein
LLAVDTNVLVYAADADSQFHRPCRDWLERQRARPDAWYTTWGILYESMRVTTHPRVMRRPWSAPAVWEFVVTLLASPGNTRPDPTSRRRRRADHFGVAASRRQPAPRRAHRHSHARARDRTNLHARYRFQSISVPRSGRSASTVATMLESPASSMGAVRRKRPFVIS